MHIIAHHICKCGDITLLSLSLIDSIHTKLHNFKEINGLDSDDEKMT